MPHEPVLDVMRRTMANLAFVEEHAGREGPFEVTQLINSFLGALAHPWEKLSPSLDIPLEHAALQGWPIPSSEIAVGPVPPSLAVLIRWLRNGVAHGNLRFLSGGRGEIKAIQVENFDRGRRTWRGTITIKDMRALLHRFVGLIEEIHVNAQRPSLTA
jgi:hypothetical protein